MNLPKLRAKIVEKNISRNILCELWKCSPQAVSNKTHGKTKITLEEAKAFSDFVKLEDSEKLQIFFND